MPHERPLSFLLNWMVQFLSVSPTSFPSQSWIFWKRLFTMFLSSASKGRCSHVMKRTGNDIVTFFHIMFSICPCFSTIGSALLGSGFQSPTSSQLDSFDRQALADGLPLPVNGPPDWTVGNCKSQLKYSRGTIFFGWFGLSFCVTCFFSLNYICFQDVDKLPYHRNNTLLLYDLHWFTVSPILYLLVLLYAHIYICIEISMHSCTVHTHVHWCNGGFRDNL